MSALGNDDCEAGGAKSVAADESKVLEKGEMAGEEVEIVVGDRHTLEGDTLEGGVSRRERPEPWLEVAPPARRHESEVGESGPPFNGNGGNAAESGGGALRGDSIAVSDEELGSSQGFGAEPGSADEGGGVTVATAGEEVQDVLKNVLEHLIRAWWVVIAAESRRVNPVFSHFHP